MTPVSRVENLRFSKEAQSSRTFSVKGDHVSGMTDGLEAVKQAVYFALSIERYDWPIYSWNYGVELRDLFGQPKDFVQSELKRRIADALTQDNRIERVSDFEFAFYGSKVTASFTVHSIFGDFETEKEVNGNV